MANTAESLYELIRQLPAAERLRLVEKIAHDLRADTPGEPAEEGEPFAWTQLAGAAPDLLGGEDPQAWVSGSRQAADEARDHRVGRKP